MLVPMKQLPVIAKDYIMEVMLPKTPNDFERMKLGFIIPYLPNIVNNLVKVYRPKWELLGAVDKEDNIVLELAIDGAKSALQVNNGKAVFQDLQFDITDVNVIATIAQRYVVPSTASSIQQTIPSSTVQPTVSA